MELCSDKQQDPYLQDSSTTIQHHLLLSFAAQNRWLYYYRYHQVGTKTPETALRHVAQTIVMSGYSGPRWSYGYTDLDLPFYQLLKSYKNDDPAQNPQLDIPISYIQCVADFYYTKQTLVVTVWEKLLTIRFFFLLSPGEYAMISSGSSAHSVQLRRQDVHFCKRGTVLPHAAPLAGFQKSDSVRLYLDNQKNRQRGNEEEPCTVMPLTMASYPSNPLTTIYITSIPL